MTTRVQTLLKPADRLNLVDAAISMPDELRQELRGIFSFAAHYYAEFEGSNIFDSVHKFYDNLKNKKICHIRFHTEESETPEFKTLYALTPIEQAKNTIALIEDQLGPENHDLTVPTNMKDALHYNKSSEIIGWMNLDTSSFIFTDCRPAAKLYALFGHNLNLIPEIDRKMDFQPALGSSPELAIRQMSVLAKAWSKPVTTNWNNKILTVNPRGKPVWTPKI